MVKSFGNLLFSVIICLFLVLAMLSVKNQTVESTPRKLPFKDTTNKDLLKSALKLKGNGIEKIQPKQEQESSSYAKEKEEESLAASFDDFDDAPFVFPPDNNCFCCGDKRKSNLKAFSKKYHFHPMILS